MTGEVLLVVRALLAAALYGFLGYGVWVLWRDLRLASAEVSARHIPALRIGWRVDGQEQARLISLPEMTVGRDPACDLPIQDDTVSARHARLAYHHHQWWVEDLQSTNGTYINEEQVYTPTVIVPGDEIRCGGVRLSVQIDKPGSTNP